MTHNKHPSLHGFNTIIAFCAAICLFAACATAPRPASRPAPAPQAEAPALRVALYPYVPDITVFEQTLTNMWAGTGRPERIEFLSWDCYNDPFPTNADIVVAECGFLDSLVAGGHLRPLDAATAPGGGSLDVCRHESFIPFALDGCHGLGPDGEVHLYGYPQLICTYYLFGREGKPLPGGFDFAPLQFGATDMPGEGDGLLLYAGDDVTLGIVRLYLDRTLGDETSGGAALAAIFAAGGSDQLAFYPDDGDGFIRASWFCKGVGANYIDYSEALSRLHSDGGDANFTYRRLVPYGAPYFVDNVSVTSYCPEERLDGAAACLAILAGREYLEKSLWPDGGAPNYVLPGRDDVFAAFAARDGAYADFYRDATLPGNTTWRLPADSEGLIGRAAKRSHDELAAAK